MLRHVQMENTGEDEAAESKMEAVPVEDVRGMFVIRGAFTKPLGYFDSLPGAEKPHVQSARNHKRTSSRG